MELLDGSEAPLLGEQGMARTSGTVDSAPSEAHSELSELAREGTKLLDAMQDSDASQMVSSAVQTCPRIWWYALLLHATR